MPHVFPDGINSRNLDIDRALNGFTSTGHFTGGSISITGPLLVDVTAGSGMYADPTTGVTKVVDWASVSGLVIPDAPSVWVRVNDSGVVSTATSVPDSSDFIILATLYIRGSQIREINDEKDSLNELALKAFQYVNDVIGNKVSFGLAVTENATPLHLDVDSGRAYFHGFYSADFSPLTNVTFVYWYRSLSGWTTVESATAIDTGFYDDGSGTLAAIPPGNYKADIVFKDEMSSRVHVVYAASTYALQADAQNSSPVDFPDQFERHAVSLVKVVVQDGDTAITAIVDIRPFIQSTVIGSGAPITDHGGLSGLGDDDHLGYLLANGNRAFSGDADLGGNDITNVGLVDGRDLSVDGTTLDNFISKGRVSIPVRNETGSLLIKGRAVAPVGFSGVENRTLVALADKDTTSLRPAIGIVFADIPDGTNGTIITNGILEDIDTSAWALTDQLCLGNSGVLVRPPPDNSPFTGEVQLLASVSKVHAVNGSIVVAIDGLNPVDAPTIFATGGTNGTPGPTNKFVTDSDPRNTNSRTPVAHKDSHKSGGSDALLNTDLIEAVVKRLRETGGPTDLTVAGIADGELLSRSGVSITGVSASVVSMYKQSAFAEAAVDVSTTSTTFVDLLTVNLTTGIGYLLVNASLSTHASASVDGSFRVLMDGTPIRGTGITYPGANRTHSVALMLRVACTSGAHTVKLQWKASGGTLHIQPVTLVDSEHASLLVEEVSV